MDPSAAKGAPASPPIDRVRRAAGRLRRQVGRGLSVLPSRPSLDAIGLRTGTDKASTTHGYLDVYEQALGHLRDEKMQVLEIGVHKGSSLRMWESYFPNARIIGVDRSRSCAEFAGGRVTIEIGDQGNEKFIQLLGKRYRPTVLIDDGSHRWDHQILSFRNLWPAVKPGGYYILEDIHTSFGDDYRPVYGQPGTESAYDYVAGIVRGIVAGTRAPAPRDEFEAYCRGTVESVQQLKHSIIFRKRDFPQPWFTRGQLADRADAVRSWRVDAGSYDRVPASLVGSVTPAVEKALASLVDEETVSFPPATSAILENVTVHRWGPATTPDGMILAETLNAAQNIRLTSGLYRPWDEKRWVTARPAEETFHPAPSGGRTHVLVRQTWDRNYGHWLIDAFGRLGAIRDHIDLSSCVFLVNKQVSKQLRSVVLDCFELAGVGADQVEFCDIAVDRYERLLVPGTVAQAPTRKSPLAIRFLEDIAASVPAGPATKVYLSRSKATRRHVANEDAVVEVLTRHGYAIVHPEDLTLREQIETLRGATHVVADMGAAMANLVFAPKGVHVLALATEAMKHDYFYDIVCLKEGRYRGLQGSAVVADGESPNLGHDFVVDLAVLEASLEWLEAADPVQVVG